MCMGGFSRGKFCSDPSQVSEKTFRDVDRYKDQCWQRYEACYRQEWHYQYCEWQLELSHELDVLHNDGDEWAWKEELREKEAT